MAKARLSLLAILLMVVTGAGGCGSLVDSFDDIGVVSSALTFSADERSEDPEPGVMRMTVVPLFSDNPWQGWPESSNDTELAAAERACTPRKKPAKEATRSNKTVAGFLPLDPSSAILAAGQILTEKIFAELQGRIKRVKDRNQAALAIHHVWSQQAWSPWEDRLAWTNVGCIAIERVVETPKKTDAPRLRMRVVLQRRPLAAPLGESASILFPIYARVDRSMAATGAGNPGVIRLAVTTTLAATAPSASPRPSRGEVVTVLEHATGAMRVPLGTSIAPCKPWQNKPWQYPWGASAPGSGDPVCGLATDLVIDPLPTSVLSLRINIVETGSALSDAEAAATSLAVLRANAKPSIDALLQKLAARAGP